MDFPVSRNQFLLPNAWSLVIVARMCRQAYTESAVVYNHEAGCRAGHGGYTPLLTLRSLPFLPKLHLLLAFASAGQEDPCAPLHRLTGLENKGLTLC